MWQRWLRLIRNFFGFTRGEARGFSVMIGLLILVYAGWFGFRLWPSPAYQPLADQQALDSLMQLLDAADTLQTKQAPYLADGEEPTVETVYFPFDPNRLAQDSLLLLGFPPWLALRLHNYRSKGGQFRKKEDLQKLYGFPDGLYARLEPWISIPQQKQAYAPRPESTAGYTRRNANKERPKKAPVQSFNLNTADSLQLQSIYGIGPVLSSRIIKFRDGLGGFVEAGQVREVWGLPPETADSLLKKSFLAEDPGLRKLYINKMEAAELQKHPYISPKQAQQIVAYRDQHGPFLQAEDLLKLHLLDENFVKRLKPYLDFEIQ